MYTAPYELSEHSHVYGKCIHLGVCGSIAAFRSLDLVRWWKKSGIHVSATLTEAAQRFVTPLSFEALGAQPVYTHMWEKDTVFGHLEPGQNAHALLVAPASASTLAHMAYGQAEHMLSCQTLAFDGPVLVAPSMNPRMWNNAATQHNVDILRQRGVEILLPDTGGTACGDEGQGRLADIRFIWLMSIKALTPQDMQGKKVLVTLGPTREQWDAVRFWSNPSTGTMGMALAVAAWLRGAEVHAVCGPVNADAGYLPPHPLLQRYEVCSAQQMFTAAADIWHSARSMDVGIFTAAVADYSPEAYAKGLHSKFKKSTEQDGFTLNFVPNKDILHTLAKDKKAEQKIIGFAAESPAGDSEAAIDTAMLAAVRYKLAYKNADIIAGNNICAANSGFGTKRNSMYVVDAHGREEVWPNLSKCDVAWRLCSWLMQI